MQSQHRPQWILGAGLEQRRSFSLVSYHSGCCLQPWNEKMLAPWKKSYEKCRQHIKKQKHYFSKKGLYSQSYDFPLSHVWMWELDHKRRVMPRIDVFEFWCWRRLLRVPWTARRSNQSSLKEINPENSLEGLMLKLKLQYIGQLMLRANSLEKTLILGKIEGKRGKGWQKMWWSDSITDSTRFWADSRR